MMQLFVASRIIKPIKIAIIEVSPTDPGMLPRNASIQVNEFVIPGRPFSAAIPKAVAPVYPSGIML